MTCWFKTSSLRNWIHEPDRNIFVVSALAAALLFGVQGAYREIETSGGPAAPACKGESKSFALSSPMEMEHEELRSNLAPIDQGGVGRQARPPRPWQGVMDNHFAGRRGTSKPCLPSAC